MILTSVVDMMTIYVNVSAALETIKITSKSTMDADSIETNRSQLARQEHRHRPYKRTRVDLWLLVAGMVLYNSRAGWLLDAGG